MDTYPLIQLRSFTIKDAKSPEKNTITGAASVSGVMDRSWWNDVLCPGCWTKVLDRFKQNGFVAVGHDWDDLPVAMPTVAEERGNTLYTEAEFHTHQAAVDARTVCEQRMKKGLSVGLSVGFKIAQGGYARFESGADLIAWAIGKGYDMSLFDVAGITAFEGECRAIFEIEELFEYSIVTVPANMSAVATSMKGRKSQANTVGAILQAKIHQSFTVAADELAIRGYMDTDERIELSSAISTCLKLFAATMDGDVASRNVEAGDVDWVASKDLQPGVLTLEKDLESALGAVKRVTDRLTSLKDTREAEGKRVSPERMAQAEELLTRLRSLTVEPETANHDAEEKFRELTFRALKAREAAASAR